jgi:hypothetical protein
MMSYTGRYGVVDIIHAWYFRGPRLESQQTIIATFLWSCSDPLGKSRQKSHKHFFRYSIA